MSASRKVVVAALVLTAGFTIGCNSDDVVRSSAQLSDLHVRAGRSAGDAAPYSGVLTPGQFVVCTSKFSDPGVYEYAIEGDEFMLQIAKKVSMEPGECVIVAEVKYKPNPHGDISVSVTRLFPVQPFYLVRISASCSVDCLVPAASQPLVLSGSAGAIAKYYFLTSTEGQGNHGGTGTLNFSVD